MAYNGSGQFSRLYDWTDDRDASVKINATRMDAEMDGMATGLSTAVCKDGQTTITANLPMAGFKFTGMGAGTAAGNSVRWEQVFAGASKDAVVTVASSTPASGAPDILGAASDLVAISGTTTVTSLGTGTNKAKFLRFTGALTLTHNATSLILPGAANITTAAGDTCLVISDASSNARIFAYQRADGSPVGSYQPLDADLTAVAALAATAGMVSRTGAGAFAVRTLAADTGLTMTNGSGASGAPTVSVDYPNLKLTEPFSITNGTLVASVGTKILTIALKTIAGTDPSATDPVSISFRSSTVTSGDYDTRAVTGALSVAVPSTATLGFTAAMTGLVHAGFIDNAGTVELAVSQDGAIWTEDRLVSTTTVDTTADSRTVLYSTTGRTNVTCRLGCVVLIATGAVAGEWDNAPTRVTTVGNFPDQPFKNTVKAWGNANGAGTTLADSFNISSITDAGTGDITYTYAVAMGTADYAPTSTVRIDTTALAARPAVNGLAGGITTAAARFSNGNGAVNADPLDWYFSAVGR